MSTPSIQTLITQAQQVLNLKSSNEIRATLAAVLANANVGTPLNPNLTTQQLWDEFYEIVRQPSDDIMSIITDQMMRMVYAPPAPGGAGADKQVIFNDMGVLAGDVGLVYNKTTDALTVTGLVTAGSATITGALTVDTTTLVVNPSGYADRVGIGTATPAVDLHIQAAGSASAEVRLASATRSYNIGSTGTGYGSANNLIIYDITGAAERYRIASDGVATWSNVGGVAGTAMTLNATGLGLGGSPVNPLTAYGAASAKAPVLFLTNIGSPGDYGWDFSVDGAVNGNLFIRRVNAYTKNDVLEFDRANGNIIMTPSTTATALTVNGQLTFNATSNTNLRFSYRGSDGTTRTANITLA